MFADGGATSPPFTRPDPLGQGSNFLGSGKPPYPTPGKPIGKITFFYKRISQKYLQKQFAINRRWFRRCVRRRIVSWIFQYWRRSD